MYLFVVVRHDEQPDLYGMAINLTLFLRDLAADAGMGGDLHLCQEAEL